MLYRRSSSSKTHDDVKEKYLNNITIQNEDLDVNSKRRRVSKTMSNTSKIFDLMILCYLLVFSYGLYHRMANEGDTQLHFHRLSNHDSYFRRRTSADEEMPILLSLSDRDNAKKLKSGFHHATNFAAITVERNETNMTKDYGGLKFRSVKNWKVGRKIKRDPFDMEGHIYEKDDYSEDAAWYDNYYAFDDDTTSHLPLSCRRVSWHFLYNPTCNNFHEETIQHPELKRISWGAYRDVWIRHENESNKTFVFKTSRFKLNFKYTLFDSIKNDALVMERLSSSPRIIDIYGHCGTAVITEALDIDIEEYMVPGDGLLKKDDPDGDGVPKNHFSPKKKLAIALGMAQSLADLHGFKDGVIVHDDVQPSQWLLTSDWKTMKLNDFNRAEIMLWDDERQKYCKYTNGGVHGNYRSPEEVDDRYLDEKIDVFSLGNNIYCLLTGLWNFYEVTDDEVVHEKLSNRELPHINDAYRTRSYAEKALVEILERCWVYKPKKRASIFEVVEFLTNAKRENERLEAMGKII